jgi:hypothetical protein
MKYFFWFLLLFAGSFLKSQVCFSPVAQPINLTTLPTVGKVISADFDNDGLKDIIYTEYGAYLHLGLGNGTFNNGGNQIITTGISNLTATDLSGDGIPDVAMTQNANFVRVLINNGTGSFLPPVSYTVGSSPFSIVALDLNADGVKDLVTSNSGPNNISILLGTGSGSFVAGATYTLGVAGQLFTKDFNNDGNPDVILANGTSVHRVLLGNGTGGFTLPVINVFAGISSSTLTCADFTNDGILDVVSLSNSGNSFSFNSGTGTGGFNTAGTFPVNNQPLSVIDGDFNGDLKRDLAISFSNQTTSIYLGDGTGNFVYETTFFSGKSSIINVDFNNDGLGDLCTVSHNSFPSYSSFVHVLLANPNTPTLTISGNNLMCFLDANTLTATGAQSYTWTGGITNGAAFSPATTDTYTVKAIASNSCTNRATKTVSVTDCGNATLCFSSNTLGLVGDFLIKTDLNNDGNLDIAAVRSWTNTMNVYLGTGTGTFGSAATHVFNPITSGYSYNQGASDDVNGDGNKDIIVTNYNYPGAISVMLGNGSGGFSSVTQFSVSDSPRHIIIKDLDNDGDKDVAVANDVNEDIQILYGNGTGAFTAGPVYVVPGSYISALFCEDLNNDGKPDLGCSMLFSQNVQAYINAGSGTFTNVPPGSPAYGNANDAVCRDFNNDGVMDVATADYNSGGGMFVGNGTGNGLFTLSKFYASPTIQSQSRILSGDFNNDGNDDLVLGEASGGIMCHFYLGTDIGTFHKVLSTPLANHFVEGDFNNDGRLDVLSNAGILLNNATTISVSGNSPVCAGNTLTLTSSGATTYTWNSIYSGTSFTSTPTSNTIYTVVGTTTAGCSGSQTVSVSVYNLPSLTVNSGTICSGDNFTISPTGANTYTYSSGSAVVSPTINSTYTITGTDLNGCISLPVVSNVSVSPQPTITASGGMICSGDSFTIAPLGATTYTYSGGSAIISPTTTTSYSLNGSDAQGCVSLPVNITVSVNPLPAISISSSNTLICAGQTATLNATGANSYTWSTSSSASQIIVSPTITTTYSLTGLDLNNCSNNSTFTQSVSACTSIQPQKESIKEILLYPNPTNGGFLIQCEKGTKIRIQNMLGDLLLEHTMSSEKEELSIEKWNDGIYILSTEGASIRIIKTD